MKKEFLILLFITLVSLTACGAQAQLSEGSESTAEGAAENVGKTMETAGMSETMEDMEIVETVEVVIPEKAFDLSDKEPMEALKAVLLNEAPFIYPYPYSVVGKGTMWKEDRGYFADILDRHRMVITRFAVFDMDGDGVSEIILERENDIGVILLRYWDGKVLGKEFGHRSMGHIREDGSFWQSNSSAESYIRKLVFIGDSTFFDTVVEIDKRYELLYYVHDVPVSEDEMLKKYIAHEELQEIEWYEFSEEEICKRIVDEVATVDGALISHERQEYLDSFSYLLELRNSDWHIGQEKYNEDAKSYYYNCKAEMESIYELYKGKLFGEELEQLNAEQQFWQDGIDQRLIRSLYSCNVYSIEQLEYWDLFYEHGDFYLARACHLVNWYYGCDFYD